MPEKHKQTQQASRPFPRKLARRARIHFGIWFRQNLPRHLSPRKLMASSYGIKMRILYKSAGAIGNWEVLAGAFTPPRLQQVPHPKLHFTRCFDEKEHAGALKAAAITVPVEHCSLSISLFFKPTINHVCHLKEEILLFRYSCSAIAGFL